MQRRFSRRQFLKGSIVTAAAGALGLGGYETARATRSRLGSAHPGAQALTPTQAVPTVTATPVPSKYAGLRSRPDLVSAPTLHVVERHGTAAPGYIFLTPSAPAPQGAAIFDTRGRLVWYHPGTTEHTLNFGTVRYAGRDALAWWEGSVSDDGTGAGAYMLLDEHYGEIVRVTGSAGAPLDLHELTMTGDRTALVESYEAVSRDLAPYGGLSNGIVLDCVIQEIDVTSGTPLFTWRALDHVGLGESVVSAPAQAGAHYDYFHVNSLEVDRDGSILVSARNTSALYKLDRRTGAITWRLGGSGNALPGRTLRLLPATESFWFQHDARRNADGTLSLFDDGGSPYHHDGRGLVLRLDERAGIATIEQAYGSELGVHVGYQGSFRRLTNGNAFIGWGDIGRVTEFTPEGAIVLDAVFNGNSYRALRSTWHATPDEPPALAVARDGAGVAAWASWNGATEIRAWRLLGGDDENALQPLATVPWADFETAIHSGSVARVYAVEALGERGEVLSRSAPTSLM